MSNSFIYIFVSNWSQFMSMNNETYSTFLVAQNNLILVIKASRYIPSSKM